MSRTAVLISNTGINSRQRIEQAVTFVDTTRVRFVCIALIVLLGIVYLWLVNSSATDGFALSDLETRRVSLDEEYRKLEVEQTALRSLEHIEKQSQDMQMVASSQVEYIGSSVVALNGQ